MLLVAAALAAPSFTPPPGLLPDETALTLTTCLKTDAPDLLAGLGAAPRFVDVNLEDRTLTGWNGTNSAIATMTRCPAVAALPRVADGALRCTALPKGGFACKPIPGPQAAKDVVRRMVEENRQKMESCAAGRAGIWTVRFNVGVDGAPADIDMSVRGPLDQGSLECLTALMGSWRFGPISVVVPYEVVVPEQQ